MRLSTVVVGLLTTLLPAAANGQTAAPPPGFDAFVDEVLATFEVPGAAVAIVKDGQVVLAKGYGVRTIGTDDRVDARTLFGIASNTKAFTATALALLVEDGKIEWDRPVIDYLPWFRMSDPYVTAELTIRDLLVHRSGLGLGAGDLMWWPPSTYTRDEMARRLRFIPLATSFRSAYAYDNVLYGIAGHVIEAISGTSWEDFVTGRILKPVGMDCSNVLHSAAGIGGNTATTHAQVDGVVQPVPPFLSDNTNPAGGINSCADDMAKWMLVQLDSGRTATGDRLFTPATTRQLWTGVTPMPIGGVPAELAPLQRNFNAYALGFTVNDYRGHKLVSHTGGLPGYVSKVAMVPDADVGVAVLTNQESGAAFETITYHVLDHYLGADHDWLGAFTTVMERFEARIAAADSSTAANRDTASTPSLPLERYAGTYEDAWYGTVTLSLHGDALEIQFDQTPSLKGALEHWQYDTFVARWYDRSLRADAFVTFSLTPEGTVDRVRMRAVSPSTDFSFDFHDLDLRPLTTP